jgi:streptogramin lyase
MAFLDGSLWVCDTQGGEDLEIEGQDPWPLGVLLEVDPTTGEVRSTIPIDGNCGGIHVIGGSLWFIGSRPVVAPKPNGPWMESFLFEVDTVIGIVATHPIPATSGDTAYGDGEFWIVDYGEDVMNRFDLATQQLGTPIETGAPSGIGDAALAFGEGLVWETDSAKNTLLSIDPLTGEVLETIKVGASPLFLTVAEGSVWVSNYRDATVSRVEI